MSGESPELTNERVVFLNGEDTKRLERHGEVTATVFEAGDDGEPVRTEIEVVNTSARRTPDTRPLWKQLLPQVLGIAVATLVAVGVMKLLPMSTITTNGHTVVFPATGALLWQAASIVFFVGLILVALPYLPGQIHGRAP